MKWFRGGRYHEFDIWKGFDNLEREDGVDEEEIDEKDLEREDEKGVWWRWFRQRDAWGQWFRDRYWVW